MVSYQHHRKNQTATEAENYSSNGQLCLGRYQYCLSTLQLENRFRQCIDNTGNNVGTKQYEATKHKATVKQTNQRK